MTQRDVYEVRKKAVDISQSFTCVFKIDEYLSFMNLNRVKDESFIYLCGKAVVGSS
jgi:hypothetical protein